MKSATARASSRTSANGNGPHDAGLRLRRAHTAWWVAAVSLVLLLVTGLRFTRQAVEHRRVQDDLDAAAAAFTAARGADAREYAPDNWLLATSRMDEAMAELHRQEERFVLIRSYPPVHELLVRAIDAAEVAKATADTAQTAVPGSLGQATSAVPDRGVRAAIAAAIASVDSIAGLLGRIEGCPRARRAREIRNDLRVVFQRLTAYRREFDEVEKKFARGEFAAAKLQADTLKGRAHPECKDLEDILKKFRCE